MYGLRRRILLKDTTIDTLIQFMDKTVDFQDRKSTVFFLECISVIKKSTLVSNQQLCPSVGFQVARIRARAQIGWNSVAFEGHAVVAHDSC